MSRSNPGQKEFPLEKLERKPRIINPENQIKTFNSAEFFKVIEMEKRGEIIIWRMTCGKRNGAYEFLFSRIENAIPEGKPAAKA